MHFPLSPLQMGLYGSAATVLLVPLVAYAAPHRLPTLLLLTALLCLQYCFSVNAFTCANILVNLAAPKA